MVGHALRVIKFPGNLHESDERHLATLNQLICGGVFR